MLFKRRTNSYLVTDMLNYLWHEWLTGYNYLFPKAYFSYDLCFAQTELIEERFLFEHLRRFSSLCFEE